MTSDSDHYVLHVNGVRREVTDSWLGESLLDVLRDRLGLYGVKGACEQGECGSCSVMVDDVLVPISTGELAAQTDGEAARTVGRTARAAAIGGLIGGSSGARTGAQVGVGASILTRGASINIPRGTIIETTLAAPVTITL